MFNISKQILNQFIDVLQQIIEEDYSRPCKELSNATIGQHTRHCIEMYQCLFAGYENGMVCYDKRKRNHQIEVNKQLAIELLNDIQERLDQTNCNMQLHYEINSMEVCVESNYFRELMYNLEHTIHHQALIKVAIQQFTQISLPPSFGVAASTIQYKNACAQ
ncbi:MAG: DinB family protein [Bacteroidetes bacterium]|nr:DinB family protein [Bacteroidota bacterium]